MDRFHRRLFYPHSLVAVLKNAALQSNCADPKKLSEVCDEFSPGQHSLVHRLLEADILEEEPFLRKLGQYFKLPFWEGFSHLTREESALLRSSFPADSARAKGIMPVQILDSSGGGRIVAFATSDPYDMEAHALAARECEFPITWMVAARKTIRDGLSLLYGVRHESIDAFIESRSSDRDSMEGEQVMEIDDADESATVISFVNQILRSALEQEATDIHLEPLDRNLRIRYRIDGQLKDVPTPEDMGSFRLSVISRIKIMANLDIAERRLPQDGRIHLELDGKPIDVRVATIPSIRGESVSLRLLGREVFHLEKLGMERKMLATTRQLLGLPNGIILVTGPTGSGKSTSLYAFLSEINIPQKRIVTIEDPVENRLDGIVQIAVKNDIGLTFAQGLRSILRGDPNVIMVGEMRDLETAEIAIRAALTGHLVFSTLHTNDAITGVTRLIDMGIEPFLISSSVRAFIAQRLVRRLCPSCCVAHPISARLLESYGWQGFDQSPKIYRATGCSRCRGTGYRGRLAIYEMVTVTPALEELISSRAPLSELKRQAGIDGYLPMRIDGLRKAAQGQTSLEEVLSATLVSESHGDSLLSSPAQSRHA